jgi:hypothetical protein
LLGLDLADKALHLRGIDPGQSPAHQVAFAAVGMMD